MRARAHLRNFWIIVTAPQVAAIVLTLAASRSPKIAAVTPDAVVAAVAEEPAPVGEDAPPTPIAPHLLSQTGLYAADGSIDARNLPFAPQYPLWTDGAAKSRWIRLPEGARIDVTDLNAWSFPPGTILWKEFAFHGRRVETRMLWVSDTGSIGFASYRWNDEQTDAFLAPEEGVRDVVETYGGRRHSIPSRVDCTSCHLSAPSPVLGFSALQLSDDRDPLAPHAEPLEPGMVTLRTLVDDDRLSPPRPDLAENPPRIRESKPLARAALGYLSGNCGSCHNATGPLARLGLVLLHDAAAPAGTPEPALLSTLDARGRYVVPGIDPDTSRIVAPGDPGRSALLHRMASRGPSAQMPPLGTRLRDDEAVRVVEAWISGLDRASNP